MHISTRNVLMPPALRALLVLLVAAALVGFVALRWPLPPVAAVTATGVLAAGGAALLRLDRWWPPLLGGFPFALWGALALDLPAWAYALALGALLLVFRGVHRTQVPLFLSRREVWDAVLTLLPPPAPGRRPRIIDLGSGLGGLPRHLARVRPDCDCVGVELAPLPAWFAHLRQRVRPVPNLQFARGDLWSHRLDDADVAFAFLSPVPMPALWRKASAEMRPGSMLVSCEFPVPGVEPAEVVRATNRPLYVYRV
jgi:SAM-dependent methyltransferase